MARFYFDVCEDSSWIDDEDGLELSSTAEAKDEASRALLEMAGNAGRSCKPLRLPLIMKIRVREPDNATSEEVSVIVLHAASP